jgi:hypothetical protein
MMTKTKDDGSAEFKRIKDVNEKGARHQTVWTWAISRSMHLFSATSADQTAEPGKSATFTETER